MTRSHRPLRTARPRRTARPVVAAVTALTAAALVFGASACGGRATTHHKPGTSHEQAGGSVGRLLTADDGSGNRLRQVDADNAPSVTVAVRPDSEDGWNVHLTVRNFRFTPDSVGGAALLGRGHARLFLDGHPSPGCTAPGTTSPPPSSAARERAAPNSPHGSTPTTTPPGP